MRYVALAFGIIAGLVASLVLALGGLDAELAALGGVQLAATRFGLFVVANLGVFGAGLVLGAPVIAFVLFILGAIGWLAASLVLRHGLDLVMFGPPALLLLAAGLSLFTALRRRQDELPPLNYPQSAASQRRDYDDEDDDQPEPDDDREDLDELPPISVGAGFFGEGGTAMPLGSTSSSIGDNIGELDDERPRRVEDWRPGRKRPPPPRTLPAFREIDDDEEEDEGGFSRVARGMSTVLSFGLYAALAGAAILIFFNIQTNRSPNIAPVEPVASSAAPPSSSAAASSQEVASTSLPPLPDPSSALASASEVAETAAGLITADPDSLIALPSLDEAAAEIASSALEIAETPSVEPSAEPSVEPTAAPADSNVIMPWPVPASLAAERAQPAARKPAPPPAATTTTTTPRVNTTGL